MYFNKNTSFKSYGIICSPQQTLTVLTASSFIEKKFKWILETIGRLVAVSNAVIYDESKLIYWIASSVGVLGTPLMHDLTCMLCH